MVFRMAGVTKKSPVAEIFDSMDYGPAPESQNEANKWLDNHKRKFGHFVNGKWYEPEGREYYTSKAPMNHSVLAETIQGNHNFLQKICHLFARDPMLIFRQTR